MKIYWNGESKNIIGPSVKHLRKRNNLTQKELAEKLGKSQAIVSKWENADCNFQIKTLIEISQRLNLPLTISFRSPISETKTYFVSPTPAATAASVAKYVSATSPEPSWQSTQ